MIIKIGIKTTEPELVAYRDVEFGENEASALATLNASISSKGVKPRDPSMVVYLDDMKKIECRKEVMIPLDKEIPGVPSKIFPRIRVGFILFADVVRPISYYYEQLLKHLEELKVKPKVGGMCTSIEAIYEPEQFGYGNMSLVDEDKSEVYETEVMIPIED